MGIKKFRPMTPGQRTRSILDNELQSVAGSGIPEDAIMARKSLPEMDSAASDDDPLADVLGEWLRCYGPVEAGCIAATLGIGMERLESAELELGPVAADTLIDDVVRDLEEEARVRGVALTAALPERALPIESPQARPFITKSSTSVAYVRLPA